jgi:hypothetical protein
MPKIAVEIYVPPERPTDVTVAPSDEATVVRSPDVRGTNWREEIDAREGLVRFDSTDLDRAARALVAAGFDQVRAPDTARACLRAVFAGAKFDSDRG